MQKSMRDDIVEQNKEIAEGVYTAIADPQEVFVPPSVKPVPPYLNFAPLENALDSLSRSTDRFEKMLAVVKNQSPTGMNEKEVLALNKKLMMSERVLTSPEGLPGRPWFKHMVYAPGMYTGYGVKTIPGVREAIEQKNWKEADKQIGIAATVFDNEAALIDAAANDLDKLAGSR
jgi:N-acetylated-alpha-linked acidic dipeptidase